MEITKQCDKCANTEICKYREEYKRISAAVANLTICEEIAEGAHSIRKVSDIPYINVIVECKHFRRAFTVRAYNIDCPIDTPDGVKCTSTAEAVGDIAE